MKNRKRRGEWGRKNEERMKDTRKENKEKWENV